jgi:hypothetical protein
MEDAINFFISNCFRFAGGSLLGFVVGVLTGLFGAGGGFIVVPALNIFLGLGMNYAVGTSACQVLGASGMSLWHHLDRRMMGIRVALLTGIGIPLGAFLGTMTVRKFVKMPPLTIAGREIEAVNFILLGIFAVFLSLIATWLFLDNFWLSRHKHDDEVGHKGLLSFVKIPPMVLFRTISSGSFSAPLLTVIGLLIGYLSGLLGIGGGVVMMPLLFYIVGQGTKYAANTSTMLVFISGFFATVSHAMEGNVDYLLVIFLVAGAFFGTRSGAAIQKKISGKSIRKYFAFVVLAAVLMVFYKLYMMIYK